MKSKVENLQLENQDLRNKVQELEDTLNAIKSGDVDAIILDTEQGEKIFSLTSTDTSYRIFIEQMTEGVAILSEKGVILYCNKTLAGIFNEPKESITGNTLDNFLNSTQKKQFNSLIKKGLSEKAQQEFTLSKSIDGKNHKQSFLFVAAPFIEDYSEENSNIETSRSISLIAYNVTSLKLLEKQLIEHKKNLEKKVQERTHELLKSNQELTAAYQQLQANEQQLRASNQQLAASEQQLKAANQQLKAYNQQLGATEQQLRAGEKQLKKTLESLTETNRNFEKAQEMGKIANYEYDIVKETYYVSNEAKRIYGYSLDIEEFSLDDVWKCIPDAERVQQAWVDLLENDKPYNIEHEIRPVSGPSSKTIVAIGEVVKDVSGNPIKVIGLIQDITDLKEAEKERRKSDERFRIAQDMSPDGFTILQPIRDEKGSIIDFSWIYENNAVAKMNGTDPNDIVGKRLLDLFPGHRGTKIMNAYQKVADSGRPITIEENYKGESIGQLTWFRIVIVPMSENIAILAQDITENKNAEASLKESEIKFRTIFEALPIGISVSDDKGNIIQGNKFSEKLLGLSEEEQAQRKIDGTEWKIIKPDGSVFPADKYASVIALKEDRLVENVEMGVVKSKNEISWINVSAIPIPLENYGVLISYNDITEMKIAESAIKKQSDLLAKSQEIGNVGTWEIDIKTNDITWTPETYRIFSIEEGTPITYELFLAAIHPEDRDYTNNAWKEGIESREYDIEHRIIVNGEVRWVREKAEISVNESGEPAMAIGLTQDITKFKTMLSELEERDLKLRKALGKIERSEYLLNETGRMAQVGGWGLDIETMTPYFSDETYRIYDIPQGNPPKVEDGINFYAPEARPIIQKALDEAIEKQKPYDLTLPFISGKGIKKWVRTLGRVQLNNKKPARIYGAIQDVTLQKEAELNLKRLNNNLQFINKTLIEVSAKNDVDEIAEIISDHVYEFIEDCYVAVSLYDENSKGVRVRAMSGFGSKIKAVSKTLGNDPTKMVFDSQQLDKTYEHYTSGKLIKVEGGLAELMAGQISKTKCKIAEKFMGVKAVYTAGFASNIEAKGGIVIFMKNSDRVFDYEPVEIIIGYLGELLQNRLASIELKKHSDLLLKAQAIGKVGSWIHNLERNETVWSEEMYSITEIPRSTKDLIGAYSDLIHPQDRKEYDEELSKVLKKGGILKTIHRIITPNGKLKWLHSISDMAELDNKVKPAILNGSTQDITEQKTHEQELKKSLDAFRMLTRHNDEIRENERHYIAMDLHDDLGQILTGMKIEISLIKKKFSGDRDDLEERLGTTLSNIDSAIKSVQRITSGLRPPVLDKLGLIEAISAMTNHVQKSSGIEIISEMPKDEPGINLKFRIVVYRIIQEAITNVLRHAKATRIKLNIREEDSYIHIQIKDNGIGIKPASIESPKSYGLMGMQERVNALNGTFKITSPSDGGTVVGISFPI